MATLADVARLANVSIATASRVINGKDNVERSTKLRVLKAVDELSYTPNILGRYLRKSETGIILVSIPNITNPFYAEMIRGISDCATEYGYNIMLCCNDGDWEKEKAYCDVAKTKLAEGMIFMAAIVPTQEIVELSKLIPVVQCSEYDENAKTPIITTDNVGSAFDAVNHLIRLGHRRIGMLSSSLGNISALDREKGYKKALKEADIPFDESLIVRCDYDTESSKGAALELLTAHKDIDAVFCISDIMAFNVIKIANSLGLRVPDDLSVMGFDDIPISIMSTPTITTVNQQSYQLGYYSMKTLYERTKIEKHLQNNTKMYIKHEIIERESTRKR